MRELLRRTIPMLTATILLAACDRAPATDPRLVTAWMRTLYGAIRVERLSPPVAARLMGYATTALYAGLSSASPDLPPPRRVLNVPADFPERPGDDRSIDATIAAVMAERVVLDTLLREGLPTTRAAVGRLADSLAVARVALGVGEAARVRSEAVGRRLGLAIVAWSRADGFDGTRGRPFTPRVGIGLWANDAPASIYASQNLSGASQAVSLDNPANTLRPGSASDRALILNRPKPTTVSTLPAVNMSGATEPYWAELRPFVLRAWNACPLAEPPPYATDTASILYQNAREVQTTRAHLTPEQRAIALHWADNGGETGTPVGHWISIASQMVSARRLPAGEAARLMLLTAVAQADAFIAAWGYKYQYSLIRPRAYIRRVIDPAWEPLIPTPPFPEYPSAHSTQSAAAAEVMSALLGDPVAFDDSTGLTIGNAVRRFPSFRAAADEAGLSRIIGGIHFPYGNVNGRALGRCIGAAVMERWQKASAP